MIGLLASVPVVAAQENPDKPPQRTPTEAARAAARDWLAPLARPDLKRVFVRVDYCRDRGKWDGCRVHVTGATRCNGVLQVQVVGTAYQAWMPRMRCR